MSKKNRSTNVTKLAPATKWENERRRQTRIALRLEAGNLADLREQLAHARREQDRALEDAERIHAALQRWVDGGHFPNVATQFMRLWSPIEADINGGAATTEARRNTLTELHDEATALCGSHLDYSSDGLDCGELQERVYALTENPLRAAGGFMGQPEVQDCGKQRERAA